MLKPFDIPFSNGRVARAVRVEDTKELLHIPRELNLGSSRPVIVLVGGAGGLTDSDLDRLRALFTDSLAPLAESLGAAMIDGGTDAGVMQLMGQARAAGAYHFPLIGVAVEAMVTWPGLPERKDTAPLEPHHTHFVFVPGSSWGDEAEWIPQVAKALTGASESATVLIDGGEVAWQDVLHSVRQGRTVIVVDGSGRTADQVAAAMRGEAGDERAQAIIASGRLMVVNLADGPMSLTSAIESKLIKKE